jgi:hypothetical protein
VVALQQADHADQGWQADGGAEHLDGASSAISCSTCLSFFAGVGEPHAARDFRREARRADEFSVPPSVSVSPLRRLPRSGRRRRRWHKCLAGDGAAGYAGDFSVLSLASRRGRS